jgi:hypothetical protein
VVTTKSGALKNKGLSTLVQGTVFRARIGAYQDWARMVQRGPPEQVFRAPVLEKCPFPEVLVGKAYSLDGEGVELVFYPGNGAGVFRLGFTRMKPGATYILAGRKAVAGADGTAEFDVAVDGRTAVKLELVKGERNEEGRISSG